VFFRFRVYGFLGYRIYNIEFCSGFKWILGFLLGFIGFGFLKVYGLGFLKVWIKVWVFKA